MASLVLFVVVLVCSIAWGASAAAPENSQYHPFQLSQLLLKLNETLDPIVDATPYRMHNVYHRGNYCPFRHKVLAKMLKGEPLTILIVGGSVTWGAELRDRNNQRWSNSFTNILKSSWYNGTINVHNIAVGACNIDTWIYKVNQLASADMIIMDLSVNDQGFDLQALPHLYRTFIQLVDRQPNHPAMLFHLAYRTGLRSPNEIQGHCPAVNQSITCCNGVVACKRWWEMSEYVAKVLQEYKIPYISYKELTWPVLDHPPAQLDQYWNGLSHPDYKAHALMAKLIAFGFYMNLKQSVHISQCAGEDLRYVQSSQVDESVTPLCAQPVSQMMGTDSIESQTSFNVAYAGKNWQFYADSKQKFGFILNTTSCVQSSCVNELDNKLSLKVKLGHNAIIQVYYLKSFGDEMGAVDMFVDSASHDFVKLDGKWSLRVDNNHLAFEEGFKIPFSVTRVATVSGSELQGVSSYVKGDHTMMASLVPGEHVVHFLPNARALDGKKVMKFKLIGVTTC